MLTVKQRIGRDRVAGCLVVGLALALSGCASVTGDVAVSVVAAPGKYDIYSCTEIEKATRQVQEREKELEQLMARSAQSPGGEIVNALAYRSEHLRAKGDMAVLQKASSEKQCVTQSQWSSERSMF